MEICRADGEPVPLTEVDEWVDRQLLPRTAPVQAWLSHHHRAAAAYDELALAHQWHHDEALFWARREREKAEELQRTGMTATRCTPTEFESRKQEQETGLADAGKGCPP
jgi:hypothetical protein